MLLPNITYLGISKGFASSNALVLYYSHSGRIAKSYKYSHLINKETGWSIT